MLLRLAPVAAAALVLAACGGGGAKKQTTSAPATHLAPGCGLTVANHAVTNFLAALTSGNRARIAARVSPADDFVRLTVQDPDGRRFTTASRVKAIDWLVGRHAYGERDRMLRLVVSRGIDANHDSILALVSRSAVDFHERGVTVRLFQADGSINCLKGSVSRLRLQPSS